MPLAKIYRDNEQDIQLLASALNAGKLVAVPTETVYGLAANALDPQAVRSIFEIKGRPLIDPLIVHVADIKQATSVAKINPAAQKLAKTFWPGPLTFVLEKTDIIPDIVTANLSTVAIRSPKHPIFRKLLSVVNKPLAVPSANPFGYVSPTHSDHVLNTLGDKIEYILEGGSSSIGIESTVVDLSDPTNPMVLRLGPISIEDIEAVLGQPVKLAEKKGFTGFAQKSPGLLDKHYSPHTQVVLIENNLSAPNLKDCAIVYFKKPKVVDKSNTFWLTESGLPEEAAKNLYHLLQQLDSKSYSVIIIEKAPNVGLGIAINDRLKRASS